MDPTVPPVGQPPRKIPVALEETVDEKLRDLLHGDIIERSESFSPWQSPLVIVYKKSGDIRLCVDLRKVNRAILRQPQPFPTFEEVSVRFYGACLFSRLDIEQAFHQVELDPDCRDVTTFNTSRGTFRFKRLTFGLTHAPELFQRIMEFVLRDLQGVVVYIDDIIVFGKDEEEHDNNLNAVLERLDEFNVRINTAKCEFRKTSIDFLATTSRYREFAQARTRLRL